MFGFLRKSGAVTLDQLVGMAGWIGWGTSSGTSVNEVNAVDVTAVFCAARVIAEGCAQVPINVMSDPTPVSRRVLLPLTVLFAPFNVTAALLCTVVVLLPMFAVLPMPVTSSRLPPSFTVSAS